MAKATRVAWITGASRGIGRATAHALARDGYDIAVGYHRDEAAAQKVCDELHALGIQTVAVGGDAADEQAVHAAHRTIVDTLGPVDVLVASHGIYARSAVHELDRKAWQRTIDVNLTGAFLCTQAVLPAMRRRKHGRIVFLGSIRGRTGSAHGAHYAASKAALVGLARSLAQEVAPDGVTVNVIAPGMIDTDILAGDSPAKRAEREATVPVGRIASPDEVAHLIAFVVSDKASYITAAELRVDGGLQMG